MQAAGSLCSSAGGDSHSPDARRMRMRCAKRSASRPHPFRGYAYLSLGRGNAHIVLVPASGAEGREYLLPFAHFLAATAWRCLDTTSVGRRVDRRLRTNLSTTLRAMAWPRSNSLKRAKTSTLHKSECWGWSQAGWVMPLVAAKVKSTFVISISGVAFRQRKPPSMKLVAS